MTAADRRSGRTPGRHARPPARGARRVVAVLGVVATVLTGTVLGPGEDLSPAAAATRATAVTVSVVSVNPSTPAITSTPAPLTITVSLLNTTDAAIPGVRLTAERGDPIGTQDALNTSLTSSAARTGGLAVKAVKAVGPTAVTLPPGTPVRTTFRTTTTTSTPQDGGLCLCETAGVYPIDLTAQVSVGGSPEVLGGTRTYLPAFDVAPAYKLGVTWVWPLIDRPHRAVDGKVFTDDDLAASVAGGRLDRALDVVERLAGRPGGAFPLTLMLDPDLIDALQTMATTAYTVRDDTGVARPGAGQQAAAAWLARLRAALTADTHIDVEFTPLGDPDITGLAERGETWTSSLTTRVENSVTSALGGRQPLPGFAWPPTNSATVPTLDRLVSARDDTVLLDSSRVRPSTSGGIPVTAARVRTSSGTVNALLTAPALQRYAQSALTGSTAALPALSSELAVRVSQRPGSAQYAVLAAPRYVDPTSPDLAANVIETTSSSVFSQPVSADTVMDALPSTTPAATARRPAASSNGLSSDLLDSIHTVTGYLRPVNALFGGRTGSTTGRAMLATLPDSVQRAESAAWSTAGSVVGVGGGPTMGGTRSAALVTQLAGYLGQVRILNRSLSSYTLASSNSPLPVTVVNDSPYTVNVIVSVSAAGGLPGFARRRTGTVQVGPRNKTTFSIRTSIQRSGRIPVDAQLRTTNDYDLGSVTLYVHSTVLGTIGVVITVVSGVVLALALLVRFGRRVLRLRRTRQRAGA